MSLEEQLRKDGASGSIQVSIVGVGGAGNNLLSQAMSGGVSPKNCVAVNTDRQQLSESSAKSKVLLGETNGTLLDHSRNAGGASELTLDRIRPFTNGSDFTIVLTALGGVTGTKTAPMIAQLHRTNVRSVISVVALPFTHERQRRLVALRGLKRMIEACDCTIIIDNSVQKKATPESARTADETATLTVRCLADFVGTQSPIDRQGLLKVLSQGEVATVCTASVSSEETVQSAIIDMLRTPSASIPLARAKGAILLCQGVKPLSSGQTAVAYETIASLVGHDVDFVRLDLKGSTQPSLSLFLTGYTYGSVLGAFVDLIEDIYDMEFGLESGSAEVGLTSRLYQMESF